MHKPPPKSPSVRTFVAAENGADTARRPTTEPPSARRAPVVNEAILERATAKLEALSDHFDRLVRESPTKADLHTVFAEARQTRRLLEEHLAHDREDRARTNQRLEGIMSLLGEVLARLPVPAIPPAPETPPPETLPERT